MGFVFRAEDEVLRRPVALKVMRPEIAAQPTARERFLREGRAAAAIKSDHVITIYDVGEENDVVFLAMEFLAGQNLDNWLKSQPTPVPGKAVVWVAKDILKGLVEAHEKELIHRDIKPANLWIEAGTNRIKLLDFGLTRGSGAEKELTSTGVILGTPAYMAPEQARGLRVDGRADLFSVGVVLYRMITGKSPFVRDEMMATLFAVAFDPVPPVASLGADIPDVLGQLIDQLLAKSADERPQTARAALAVVLEVERQLRAGQRASPTPTRPDPPQPPPLRPEPVQNDRTGWSDSAPRVLADEEETNLVPVRKSNARWILAGMAATVFLAMIVAFIVSRKRDPDNSGEGTGREMAGATSKGDPSPGPAAATPLSKPDEKAYVLPKTQVNPRPEVKPDEKKETAPAPPKQDGLLPGEVMQPFEYVIDGVKTKGTRPVLKVDLGNGEKMEFVRIPKGTFQMGASDGDTEAYSDEKEPRKVVLDGFYLGKYEVTQAEYKAVTGKTPSNFKGDRLPVENVSWKDADQFCKTLSDRIKRKAVLPSEAQWEYACRAGTTTPYHFGAKWNADLANNNGKGTVVVGSYPANPWGLHDMLGNVYEWCQDCYGPYDKVEIRRNPIQLDKQSEEHRVLRGGAWNIRARYCRASTRGGGTPDVAYDGIGFRVCLPLD
jgi:formylglycine-generating enzyme required for sulfatase activity/tRNA A-37 threonylcarbamoyl transferase component Bud32